MSNKTLGLSEHLYEYLLSVSLREPDILRDLRDETAQLPEHEMQIAPEQGQFMQLLVKLLNVHKAIEVGTFTGYSALSMVLGMPEKGRLWCCDNNENWTAIAQRYWQRAQVAKRITLCLGDAGQSLDALLQDHVGSVDLIFIDADKENYLTYYETGFQLLRPGGVLLIDNVLWGGAVVDVDNQEATTRAIREFNEYVHNDERVELSLLPIADGLTLVRKC
jgi:caffeoyl-CoA O-methyltransferase